VLGVRPENLRVGEQGPLLGRVELVEFLGERTLAHLKLDSGTPLIVTVPAGMASPRLGGYVAVSVDVAEAHLFDETGRAHHAQESLA
jgi:multiple sugar transport system ATP-binding protein